MIKGKRLTRAYLRRNASSGDYYFIVYGGYFNDPFPHVFVLKAEPNAIEGINLHYLPLLRFGWKPEQISTKTPQEWAQIYRNMVRLGYFGKLLEDIEKTKRFTSARQWYQFYRYLKRRYPWVVEAYRRYLIDKIKVVFESDFQ